ncbi:receptor-interacting serine/threonine-protein kinase 3-like isoform X2 [Centroberyx affinis]|uniref:receptor-interacting serine/threonine-protein kinase 3-like isoform X2 n=1 Tax=Centroberyx affinis TaxID=166261 RepID=UPI003A5B9B46
MALPSHKAVQIGDDSLQDWKAVGAGGFGQVYTARHKDWGFNVAIKVHHHGYGSNTDGALWHEAYHMEQASNPFVLRLFGVYRGCPPGESSVRLGIVMEFMERDSLQSLQQALSGPPPWPLAFRLAHQVALGMNFLHKLTPALLHKDLKPSNVLLDEDLNVKLTDFGLSRVSTSDLNSSRFTAGEEGSLAYMPPEAFDPSYEPVRAYDMYSYGILLWSILTGKEPYPAAPYSRVALRIPLGDRPPYEVIDQSKADGIGELVDLMKKCWVHKPSERPTFQRCLLVTEHVYSKHKDRIRATVTQVLSKLEPEDDHLPSNVHVPSSFHAQPPAQSMDTVDHASFPKTKGSSKQDSVATSTVKLSDTDKAKFVDDHKATLIQDIANVMAIVDDLRDMVHPETYARIQAKETNQEKVRVIYTNTLRSGQKVKAAFYDALIKNELYLMRGLVADD